MSRAAGFPQGAGIVDLTSANFPSALAELSLDELLGLILTVGSLGRAQPKQSKFSATDLDAAAALGQRAGNVLSDWPHSFHDLLRRLLPKHWINPGAITLHGTFGNFS